MNNEFIPVILGIDVGAYSVARTIYEHYKIKSIVIGKYTYWMTKYSKITDVLTIDNMTEEYTILIIAHRLSTVINSDKILFLDDGKIIDSGSHEYLLKNCKKYQKLYEKESLALDDCD